MSSWRIEDVDRRKILWVKIKVRIWCDLPDDRLWWEAWWFRRRDSCV